MKYDLDNHWARGSEVAPLAGAWVEILRVRNIEYNYVVAPLAGAWVEISSQFTSYAITYVAPLAGAWVEIVVIDEDEDMEMSHPSRVRGLKY